MCLAIPGRIVSLDPDEPGEATAEIGGVRRRVNVDLLREEGVGPGDWILVHVGFALSKVGEEEAREQLRLLAMLGEDGVPEPDPGGGEGGDPDATY
ncbi:HypC/HybG/HupF family hydrogenase formation chaperone [Tautonia sociabilis]|uniref:HypC/HybG/HupF family hydrogenase formation chaperone n=1 Tax=Tautonia sociabilis TaxID=2080755 RepID=A0A432MGC2_9BACT|nr:HypC/HybG/HupF family hydrogenase formation chaperone [Tautonia sociabilis]RUL85635.1 HypC/HybG/HupF family hydrogenase formation chaperone [Tautonia sociabilis]